MSVNSLRDGFVTMCFDSSLNAYDGGCRVLLEGQMLATGTAKPGVPIRVASKRDISTLFGAGSVIAESLRVAFDCCGTNRVELWALPIEDLTGGVAAVYSVKITGTAVDDGRIDLYMGESRYNISVRVQSQDTPSDIATAIVAAIHPEFPFTVSVDTIDTDTLLFTAKNKGTVGNFLKIVPNWHGRLNYMPGGVTLAVTQTTQGTGDPANQDYSVLGQCCYCCLALLYSSQSWQNKAIAYLDDAWSCDKPQCFGHGYTYNTGTLGQILATGTNTATISRIAHDQSNPILPYLKVAAYAVRSCCQTIDNPEISIQGPDFGVLSCVSAPSTCDSFFTFDEQEQLREAGFVVTVPVSGGEGILTSPMVTNDVTNYLYDEEGRPNATFRDVSSRRLASATAEAFAIKLQEFNGLGFFTKNTNIPKGTFGTNINLMKSALRAWMKDNVGVLFSEFDNIDNDLIVRPNFETAAPCMGEPGHIEIELSYRPPVRIKRVSTLLRPRLLDNCQR